jgi:protein O-GlcNAc transferase
MKKVFSFSLFGSAKKYCLGMLKNIELIQTHFPDWFIYIWIGDGVPEDIILQLNDYKSVVLISTNQTGLMNMSYRFFSIDFPDVEVMCVRDADSRINERDKACIEDFMNSDKLFHIIRDHPNHHHPIMGGMWGVKKNYMNVRLLDAFQRWKQSNSSAEFWNDMDFIKNFFYPDVLPVAMIHDEYQTLEPPNFHTPFRVPLDEKKQHFIGQVYEFDEHNNEYPKYPYAKG